MLKQLDGHLQEAENGLQSIDGAPDVQHQLPPDEAHLREYLVQFEMLSNVCIS